MGAWLASLKELLGGGGPALECDPHDNRIQCCVTENISNASDSSHGSRATAVPERWEHDEKIATHSSAGRA